MTTLIPLSNVMESVDAFSLELPIRIVRVSAPPGGNAERILRIIGTSSDGRTRRIFAGVWDNGMMVGDVTSARYGLRCQVNLRLCLNEDSCDIRLADVPGMRRSMKPIATSGNRTTIGIGERLSEEQLKTLANSIVAVWIVRGSGWADNSQLVRKYDQPYGSESLVASSKKQPRADAAEPVVESEFRWPC